MSTLVLDGEVAIFDEVLAQGEGARVDRPVGGAACGSIPLDLCSPRFQRHLGHVYIATTMIYLHVPQQRQADEIGRVFA